MNKRLDRVVSIRVPPGMPEELRELTGISFSTLTRRVMLAFLQQERRRHHEQAGKPQPPKES